MAFKMSWGIFTASFHIYDITLAFLFLKHFFVVPHSSLHPGTTQSAKQRSCWDARLSSVSIVIVFMPVQQQKICHPSVVVGLLSLLSLNSWWLWWFSQLFQWFLHLKQMMIHKIWFGWGGRENKTNNCMLQWPLYHTDAVRSRMKVEQGKSFTDSAQLLYSNRNKTVW